MNEDVRRDLQQQLKALKQTAITYRQGVVTAISPLTVDLGDSGVPHAGVSCDAGYAPMVGDVVSVDSFGYDLLVRGKVAAPAKVSAYRAAALSIANGALVNVPMDTEEHDIGGFYASGAWTPPAGYYHVHGAVQIAAAVAANSRLILAVAKGGTTYKQLANEYSPNVADYQISGGCDIEVNGSQAITLQFRQDAVANLALQVGADRTWFQGHPI